MLGLFKRQPDPADAAARERVKERIRVLGGFGDDVSFAVNEIVCTDPACPGTETVILVMEPGRRTRAIKLAAGMAAVTDDMLRTALDGEDAA